MTGKIFTDTQAVQIKPNEAYQLVVGFYNMPPCGLRYEVGPRGGAVSEDGIYTAPDKVGVHVIRILCVDDPTINTFAYADVRN